MIDSIYKKIIVPYIFICYHVFLFQTKVNGTCLNSAYDSIIMTESVAYNNNPKVCETIISIRWSVQIDIIIYTI